MPKRTLLSWSSGKDSAWALHRLRQREDIEVVGLLTTVNAAFSRVAMHAVRETLLEAQAESTGLPLLKVPIPYPCSNTQYETAFFSALASARQDWGVSHIAFGDLFLEDVRRYREVQVQKAGLTPLFPLWGTPTDTLAREMIDQGLEARITCLDPGRLAPYLAGNAFDQAFLAALPANIDPCGEAGEFHTFCHAGPMFQKPIAVSTGTVTERDGFVFADLHPA